MTAWEVFFAIVAIIGLAAVTVITRSFFMLPEREVPMPRWLRRGLRYAPLAALTAVLVPEALMRNGVFMPTWADARLPALVAAICVFFWRRDILSTILAGMLVYLPLHIGLGW